MLSFSDGAKRAVAEARSHLGYREGPRSNENKFGKKYGWDRVAWCVIFAWYSAAVTGSEGGVPKTASTGAAMRWAKSVGRWRTTPQAGDWSIMANSRGATIHTDIVESYSNGRLICIGGNTSGTFNGSVNEGNGVYRNDRTAKWKQGRILGFVRPFYGVSRDEVIAIQKAVGVKADGVLGQNTVAAVKTFQAAHGLTADGFPGPSTWEHITGKVTEVVESGVKPVAEAQPTSGALDVDGRLGTSTIKALQRFLNSRGAKLKVDGKAGSATWEALQTYLHAPYVDGLISRQSHKPESLGNGITGGWEYTGSNSEGSQTVKLLQKWIGVTQDGIWGEKTTAALQRKLNVHGVGL